MGAAASAGAATSEVRDSLLTNINENKGSQFTDYNRDARAPKGANKRRGINGGGESSRMPPSGGRKTMESETDCDAETRRWKRDQ